VFEARVLSLRILTDDSKVDIGVARREAWKRLAKDNRRVNVELLAHGDVPRHMSALGDRSEQDTYKIAIRSAPTRGDGRAELTLETNTIALQAIHGLSEEVLSGSGHSRDVVLFPLNGSVDVLEDLLDRVGNFSSDTITWNQGDLCYIEF